MPNMWLFEKKYIFVRETEKLNQTTITWYDYFYHVKHSLKHTHFEKPVVDWQSPQASSATDPHSFPLLHPQDLINIYI